MNSSSSKFSCSDIIASSANHGSSGWYITHLWVYVDGKRPTYSICTRDDNHRDATKREADAFCRDEHQSWLDYAAYVAETGEDPLNNYTVDREIKMVETWTATLETWIGSRKLGLRIKSVRRKGDKTDTPNQSLPNHVRDYLEMKRKGSIFYCDGIHSFSDVCPTGDDKLIGRGATRKITFVLVVKTPIDPAKVRASLIVVANTHIAQEASK